MSNANSVIITQHDAAFTETTVDALIKGAARDVIKGQITWSVARQQAWSDFFIFTVLGASLYEKPTREISKEQTFLPYVCSAARLVPCVCTSSLRFGILASAHSKSYNPINPLQLVYFLFDVAEANFII